MSEFTVCEKRTCQRETTLQMSRMSVSMNAHDPKGHPHSHKRLSVILSYHGISMNAISKLFDVSVTTVLNWIRDYAKKQTPKPTFRSGTSVVLELDEMWHYIGYKTRKINSGKLWIWKVLDRGHSVFGDFEELRNKR